MVLERQFKRPRRGCGATLLVMLLTLLGTVPLPTAARASQAASRSFAPFNADAAGHDLTNAYLLSLLSHYMYPSNLDATVAPSEGPTTEANFEARFAALAGTLGLTFVDYIRNPFTDTEAAVVTTGQAVIIAFRGTETNFGDLSNLTDVVVDLAMQPIEGFHAGFLAAAASTVGDIRAAISGHGDKRVWLTGHSLGGAVATVTAWMLQTGATPVPVQGVSTYGAPRVFTEGTWFSDDMYTAYNDEFADRPTQRWVNNLDPVPHVPPSIAFLLPYRHIGEVNNIGVDGDACTVAIDDTERNLEVDGAALAQLMGELGTAITDGDPAAALAALGGIVDVILAAADMGDHDVARYSARIFAHLPSGLQAQVPGPPNPAAPQTSCDVVDTTPPVVTPTITGTLGNDGWYRSNVTVSWAVSDDESSVSSSGCGTTVVQADTAGLTFTCTATSAGGTTQRSVTVKRDVTPPSAISVAADRLPNSNGWYNAPFTATWTGTDPMSGIASCTQTTQGGPDTTAGTLSGTCTDAAGNVSNPVNFTYSYDATAPSIVILTPPGARAEYFQNQVVGAQYQCADGLSGITGCAGPVPSGDSIDTAGFGSHTFTVNAVDRAGNAATLTSGYTVTYAFSGFSEPIKHGSTVNEARAGSRIPFKWSVLDAAGQKVADRTDLFSVGWSSAFACSGLTGAGAIDTSDTTGQSGLRWDPVAMQYSFVAASSREDAGQCRYFLVRIGPNAAASALVKFV